jgi:hypothetical protein
MKKYVLLVALLLMVAIPLAVAAATDTDNMKVSGDIDPVGLKLACDAFTFTPDLVIESDNYGDGTCAVTTGLQPWTLTIADPDVAVCTGRLQKDALIVCLQNPLYVKDYTAAWQPMSNSPTTTDIGTATGTAFSEPLHFYQAVRSGDQQGNYKKTLTVTITV